MKKKSIKIESEEVLYVNTKNLCLTQLDIAKLKKMAEKTKRQRIRLCCHTHPDAKVHEMFIVHKESCYVRPHFHQLNDETIHTLEGCADLVFFKNDGSIKNIIQLGDIASGLNFYCKIPSGQIHTLIIRSEFFVFKEVTNGPFQKKNMVFPDWGPDERCPTKNSYVANLKTFVKKILEHNHE